MSKNYTKQLSAFFSDIVLSDNNQIFLCRNDGVLLYQRGSISKNLDSHSVGALIGGVWQAAKALASFIPNESKRDGFRLSFDTSDKGVYILPFEMDGHEYYLGHIFYEEQNPAKIKSVIRKILNDLEKYLETDKPNTKQGDNNEQYLFKDISDQEMDDIFSVYS